MTETQLLLAMQRRLRGLAKYIIPEDVTEAITVAKAETGWTLPVTTSFKEYWIAERTKRHVFDMLRSGSAHKFKVEQINLQHRFEHYNDLIRRMDRDFKAAIEDNPAEFAGVDVFKVFGTKIDAGFSSDGVGRDTTYDEGNLVIFTPTESQ